MPDAPGIKHRQCSERIHAQALIGGGDHQGLDLEDMKQHVNYAGGYHTEHPVIMEFWKVSFRAHWREMNRTCLAHAWQLMSRSALSLGQC